MNIWEFISAHPYLSTFQLLIISFFVTFSVVSVAYSRRKELPDPEGSLAKFLLENAIQSEDSDESEMSGIN